MHALDAALHGLSGSRGFRGRLKQGLALANNGSPAVGATLLIYHRIGAGSLDELDVPAASFAKHVRLLDGHDVVPLDAALDRLDGDDTTPTVVLTFDDGFDDVYVHAWPLLRERRLPFTVYLSSGFVGKTMVWEGSTAKGSAGQGLSWRQLAEMVESGLCTVGNHTHRHVRPEHLDAGELDACTHAIEQHLAVTPRHFTYPWGIPVAHMEGELSKRFRSVSTGELGRNLPGTDRMRLQRVPVRQSDPDSFFRAKLGGGLWPERAYGRAVRLAKASGLNP